MPLPAEEAAAILRVREWVGDSPDDLAIQDSLAAYEDDPLRAALSILLIRRGNLTAEPAKASIDQDASWETTREQIALLDAQIARVRTAIAAEAAGEDADALLGLHGVTTATISRCEDDMETALDAAWRP
jgi:hypothetical protein